MATFRSGKDCLLSADGVRRHPPDEWWRKSGRILAYSHHPFKSERFMLLTSRQCDCECTSLSESFGLVKQGQNGCKISPGSPVCVMSCDFISRWNLGTKKERSLPFCLGYDRSHNSREVIWTPDQRLMSPLLYHWATLPWSLPEWAWGKYTRKKYLWQDLNLIFCHFFYFWRRRVM